LAVARALGDLWSYNAKDDVFVVSPDPDLHVFDISILKDRCLILATDGLLNVLSPSMAVQSVFDTERNNERHMIDPNGGHTWINPSKKLVDLSIQRWNMCSLRADNVSVVTVMLDPPGPPRAKVLRRLHGIESPHPKMQLTQPIIQPNRTETPEPLLMQDKTMCSSPATGPKGIAIISRFPNSKKESEQQGTNLVATPKPSLDISNCGDSPTAFATRIIHDSSKTAPLKMRVSPKSTLQQRSSLADNILAAKIGGSRKIEEATSTSDELARLAEKKASLSQGDQQVPNKIQCNEISSSDNECDSPAPPPVPSRPPGGHRPSSAPSAKADPPSESHREPQPTSILRKNVTTSNVLSSAVSGPMTRTRQQSGPAQTATRPAPNASPSPPPIPAKMVRRSILPGYSGYNSDSENQPSQANKVTNLATPGGGRHLRSGRLETPNTSAKKPSSLAVTKAAPAAPRRSEVADTKQKSVHDEAKTPENRNNVSNARVLRSRNTPAVATTASQTRSKCPRSRNLSGNVTTTPSRAALPETGVKRKRASGNDSLASKMLKLGQQATSKTSAWTNPIGKRAAANKTATK
jgi:hypothetical protein